MQRNWKKNNNFEKLNTNMDIKGLMDTAFQLVKLPLNRILLLILILSNGLWIYVAIHLSDIITKKDKDYLELNTRYSEYKDKARDKDTWWALKLDSAKVELTTKYENLLLENNRELREARKEVKDAKNTMIRTVNKTKRN